MGRITEAISLLSKDKDSETSQRKATDYILEGLWALGLFGSSSKIAWDVQLKELLGMVGQLNFGQLSAVQLEEVRTFVGLFHYSNR